MEFLHDRSGLHHGALCAQNVAYGRAGCCKIGNVLYGRIKNPAYSTHFDRWTAPEVLRSQQSTKEGDIWGFAVVLYELPAFLFFRDSLSMIMYDCGTTRGGCQFRSTARTQTSTTKREVSS